MKNIIHVCGESSLHKIVMEILYDYKIAPLTFDQLNNENFKNNNAILFGDRDLEKKIKKNFFLQNNAIFFIRDNKDDYEQPKSQNPNVFYGRLEVKKFVDEIKTCFITKKTILRKAEILGDKITNITSGLSVMLTPLEKEILIFLFKNKKIRKDYLLEKILKIKKETETKTVESHLTRIRAKLIKIKSEIQIKTKDDVFYLDH
tara:strand:+ start:258 stop:866 length:609 start_codon:yes stop_codon:yes gene_type:complete